MSIKQLIKISWQWWAIPRSVMNRLRLSERMRHSVLFCFVYFICVSGTAEVLLGIHSLILQEVLYKTAWNCLFKVQIFIKLLENSLLWLLRSYQVLFVKLHLQAQLIWFLTSFFWAFILKKTPEMMRDQLLL